MNFQAKKFFYKSKNVFHLPKNTIFAAINIFHLSTHAKSKWFPFETKKCRFIFLLFFNTALSEDRPKLTYFSFFFSFGFWNMLTILWMGSLEGEVVVLNSAQTWSLWSFTLRRQKHGGNYIPAVIFRLWFT